MWVWAAPTQIPILPSLSCSFHGSTNSDKFRRKGSELRVRASFFDRPLSSRIMVRNIPYSLNESSLLKEFSTFGHVAHVELAKDEATKRSKAYAFIQLPRRCGGCSEEHGPNSTAGWFTRSSRGPGRMRMIGLGLADRLGNCVFQGSVDSRCLKNYKFTISLIQSRKNE